MSEGNFFLAHCATEETMKDRAKIIDAIIRNIEKLNIIYLWFQSQNYYIHLEVTMIE